MSEEGDGVRRVMSEAGVSVPGGDGRRFRVVEEAGELARLELPRVGRDIPTFAKELAAILKDAGAHYFTRDSEVVQVDLKARALVPVRPRAFRGDIRKWVITFSVSHSRAGAVENDDTMSLETAATVLELAVFQEGLYEVERIHAQRLPFLGRDGKVRRLEPGLDVEAQVFTMPDAIDYRMDMPIDTARNLWRDTHSEFPWLEEGWRTGNSRSFAVHTAAAISQFGWCLLGTKAVRLSFIYISNSERSGKSLLAEIALVLTHGRAATTSYKKDDEKMAASLDVLVRNRAPYAFFDNLKGHLSSTELESFLTGDSRQVRLFHTQVQRTFENRTAVFITGNGLTWSTDIDGRCLIVDLFMEEANPQTRRISRPLTQSSFRGTGLNGDLLSAMWAMVREWDRAGRPKGKRVKAGFEAWCDVFAGIVLQAGLGDPLEPRSEDATGGATERGDMFALVEKLSIGIEDKAEFRFADVVQAARDVNAFPHLMKGKEIRDEDGKMVLQLDSSSASTLSKILSADAWGGRVFVFDDGRRVRWSRRGKNRGRWYEVTVFPG